MLRITSPFHGAVLNSHHGEVIAAGLRIAVHGVCPPSGSVIVNGAPAEVAGGTFTARATLTAFESEIRAEYEGPFGRLQHTIRVVWDRHSFPRYRVSLDDNVFLMRDIAAKRYASIFDCHYLALLRRMNREYGTKFTCNLYYEADDDFTLADFPEAYRSEWEACADWLGLTFHARADKPDRPYAYAAPEQLLADYDLVAEEVRRFAGERSWIPPTVIHWGLAPRDALPGLYERGVRVLSGYFSPGPSGRDVHYWLDEARCEHLSTHRRLIDWDSGIAFSKVDLVINNTPLAQITGALEAAAHPADAEIIDLLTHEQYFWDFYPDYIPDHPQRLEAALRWLTERGYRPVFFHEGFMGAPT